jgi:glucosamine-6-phosphate deaminase
MEVIIQKTYEDMSRTAAREVADILNAKPNAVLGLATGTTPLGLYQELARMHKRGELDFSHVSTFNLDEYVGLPVTHPQSYHHFMHENFFEHLNIPPQNIHIPSGTTNNYRAFCQWYEQRVSDLGGIDVQVLGIGADGRIGFNEPGSSLSSRTRLKTLAESTIDEIARSFPRRGDVPIYAITMGVGTIMEARKCILLASGSNKASAIAAAVEGPITAMVTASALQLHPDTKVFLDDQAASGLKMREYYDWVCQKKPGAPKT